MEDSEWGEEVESIRISGQSGRGGVSPPWGRSKLDPCSLAVERLSSGIPRSARAPPKVGKAEIGLDKIEGIRLKRLAFSPSQSEAPCSNQRFHAVEPQSTLPGFTRACSCAANALRQPASAAPLCPGSRRRRERTDHHDGLTTRTEVQGGPTMRHPQPPGIHRETTSRRRFLAVAGTGVASASLLTMLQARQAPAQIKGTSLRMLMWSHFVPAYDTWFDDFAKKWGEKNGVKVRVDHIPHLELPARYAAEFAAGSGHDLIYFVGQILTGQYYKNLVDLSAISDALA